MSVDLWIHYLGYAKDAFSKDEKRVRDLFEKSLTACGLEFRYDFIVCRSIDKENRLSFYSNPLDRIGCGMRTSNGKRMEVVYSMLLVYSIGG